MKLNKLEEIDTIILDLYYSVSTKTNIMCVPYLRSKISYFSDFFLLHSQSHYVVTCPSRFEETSYSTHDKVYE